MGKNVNGNNAIKDAWISIMISCFHGNPFVAHCNMYIENLLLSGKY